MTAVDAAVWRRKRAVAPSREAARMKLEAASSVIPAATSALLALAGGNPNAITAQHVGQAAEAGDPLAQAVLDDAAEALGAGIASAINLMNPERVVLGGGVTKSGERWWRIVRETARRHVLSHARVEIVPAALGDDAPLWGAAALAESLICE